MSSDTVTQAIHRGFRIVVGAAASLLDAAQNPDKYRDRFSSTPDFNQLTDEWAVKGEETEREARRFVEQVWNQTTPAGDTGSRSSAPSTGSADSSLYAELELLTTQLSELRAHLESTKRQNDSN
jgi:polyhydroxyalkanoate synthesis regulator phasin